MAESTLNLNRDPLPGAGVRSVGIGGRLKAECADFVVEEVPAYAPCGEGEHLFLWIEKEDVSSEFLTRHLSRCLDLPAHEIGFAGMKDRRAITRQYVSVPAHREGKVELVETDLIRVLHTRRHTNKLKMGHLHGNHFSILVRDANPDLLSAARQRATEILGQGFPNYYGEQRFGNQDNTLELGLGLLSGSKSKRDIPHARRKFLLKLALSAAQSHLFNLALAARVRDGLLYRVLLGDVMQVVASDGIFLANGDTADQERFDAGEIVTTGPMFGPKMRSPEHEVLARESQLLLDCGLTREAFVTYSRLTSGTRRPYLVRPGSLQVERDPLGLRFQFTLPTGAYATTLLQGFL